MMLDMIWWREYIQKSIQNPPKILPKSFQNPPRIHPKLTLGALLGRLGRILGHLGAKRPSRTKQDRKTRVWITPPGLHFGRVFEPCWHYVGPCCAPTTHGNHILWTCTSRLAFDTPTWLNLDPSWANLSPTWPNLALLETIFHGFWKPCWHQKPNKNHYISWKAKTFKNGTALTWEHHF